jgi:hypothetical protein
MAGRLFHMAVRDSDVRVPIAREYRARGKDPRPSRAGHVAFPSPGSTTDRDRGRIEITRLGNKLELVVGNRRIKKSVFIGI